jgi:hypothetical protein
MTDYTDIELAAAQVVASLIYRDHPDGPDLDSDSGALGLYGSPIEILRDQHRDAVRLAPLTGKLYDPFADAADVWEGLRGMSSPATPYAH